MAEDELAEALAEYKKAIEEEVRLERELSNAKNKDSALMQSKKEAEKLYSKYCDASDAWRYRREVEKLIEVIISKQKGEPDEW